MSRGLTEVLRALKRAPDRLRFRRFWRSAFRDLAGSSNESDVALHWL